MPKLARVSLLCLMTSFSFVHSLPAGTYRHPETGVCLPEPDFIKEASGGKGEFKKAEIAADADRTAAAWESGETRVEMLYIRSKSEAVIDFVSKRFERLAPTQPARSQNS